MTPFVQHKFVSQGFRWLGRGWKHGQTILAIRDGMTHWNNCQADLDWNPGFTTDFVCFSSVQFRSVAQSCPALCDPMNRSTPGLPVHHQLPEFTQTHIHWVGDAIQPFHPLSSPSPPAPNPSQHQSLFQWVNSLHEVAKVLEFQL